MMPVLKPMNGEDKVQYYLACFSYLLRAEAQDRIWNADSRISKMKEFSKLIVDCNRRSEMEELGLPTFFQLGVEPKGWSTVVNDFKVALYVKTNMLLNLKLYFFQNIKEKCILAAEEYENGRLKDDRGGEAYCLNLIPLDDDDEDGAYSVTSAMVLGLDSLTQSNNPIVSLSFLGLSQREIVAMDYEKGPDDRTTAMWLREIAFLFLRVGQSEVLYALHLSEEKVNHQVTRTILNPTKM